MAERAEPLAASPGDHRMGNVGADFVIAAIAKKSKENERLPETAFPGAYEIVGDLQDCYCRRGEPSGP
jgi:hypothetical protein